MNESLRPTFDANGYPTEETCQTIEQWFEGRNPLDREVRNAFLAYVMETWNHNSGKVTVIPFREGINCGERLEFATGGWSGNEDVIGAMEKTMFWAMYWESSHRGGLYVFIVPEEKP